MKKVHLAMLLFAALPALAQDKSDVEATTTGGQKVLLHPDGRWDFVEGAQQTPAKATESKLAQPATTATTTEPAPQSGGCPPGSQGGWFGTRCILPGDKDYNRGTMNPSKH